MFIALFFPHVFSTYLYYRFAYSFVCVCVMNLVENAWLFGIIISGKWYTSPKGSMEV